MIKIDKFSYKSLRKLTVGERLNAVKSPDVGFALMSALTPTQIAELFPRYYLMREPDISGFLKAVPSSVQAARQQYYDEQLERTATGSKEGAPLEPGTKKTWWEKVKETVSGGTTKVLKPGEVPTYKLTPEQTATYDLLKSGQNVESNDPRTKFMATLTPEQLKTVGLEKIKSEDGKEMFHFNQEAFKASEEEAKKSLESKSGQYAPTESAGEKQRAIIREANKLNVSPTDLATVMMYESGGTLNPDRRGPADRRGSAGQAISQGAQPTMLGLIQFGAKEQIDYGVKPGMGFDAQMECVGRYLKDRGYTRWINEHPNATPEQRRIALYSTINAGGPDEKNWSKTDRWMGGAPGNVADKATSMFGGAWYKNASKLMEGSVTTGSSGTITYDKLQAEQRALETQRAAGAVGKLAEYTGAQMGAPGAPGVSTTAQTEGTKKLNEITSYHSAGKGYCGIGTRLAARDLFGDKYFSEGLSKGGSAQASSLSRDNNYFQGSGYYNAKQDIEKEKATDPKYLNSLPIGTVISAQGGNVHGDGHVQIKLGPNKWVSYFDQSGVLGQRSDGRQYHGYSVHVPNEKGLARIGERGFATVVNAPEGQPAPAPTIEEAHDVQQSHPTADRKLDEPTAEIDAQGRPRAAGQAPLTPSDEAAHTNVTIRRKDDSSNVPMYEPGPPSTSAPAVKGLGDVTQPTPSTPAPGEAPIVAPKVVPKGTKEPAAAVPQAQAEPATPKEAKFKFDPNLYEQTIVNKYGDFAVHTMGGHNQKSLVQEMVNKLPAGVRYEKGHLVGDPKGIREVMSGFDTEFGTGTGGKLFSEVKPKETKPEVKPVEQPQQGLEKFMEKPVEPTPAPQTRAPAPAPTMTQSGTPSATVTQSPAPQAQAAPQAPAPQAQTAPQPPAPQAQAVPKAEPPKAAPKADTPKIEVKATGGTAPADSHIQAYPIGGLRGDNSVVVDAQQQPLFTMNTKTEALLPNPQENRVDVVPTQKQTNSANEQAPNPMQRFSDDLENVRHEIKSAFSDMSVNNDVTGRPARNTITDRDSHMIDGLLDSTRIAYKNPTSQRAFNRSRFHETGDPTNDFHHSIGNTA